MMELEEGGDAAATVPEPERRPAAPWEDPELSTPGGFFRTLRELLFRPGEFFENLGREGWAEPLAFALIVSSAGLLGALFWHLLVMAPAGANPEDAAGLPAFLGLGPEALLALMAGAPVLALANLGVGGLCWWGSVALMGAGREFTPAWRVFCYAQGGMALALIPFFGILVAGVWVLALLYCGVKQVYGLSAWGSLGAVAVFLSLQAALAMTLFISLAAVVALLGFLLLLA
jgi:hypothetical protein